MKTILVVEDNDMNLAFLTETLTRGKYDYDIARDGKEGVKAVKKSPDKYDAVLMDIEMPTMNGYDAAREIRKFKSSDELPIIALTIHKFPKDIEKSLESGMNAHVAKPINIPELYATLDKFTGNDMNEAGNDNTAKTLPGLNIPSGLENVDNDGEFYLELLERFANTYSDISDIITQLIADNKLKEAEDKAHMIKGIAGNLSAMRLFESARQLEYALRDQDSPSIEENMVTFKQDIDTLLDSISRIDASYLVKQ